MPPWICRALLATRLAISLAYSLAMALSAEWRTPLSFSSAARSTSSRAASISVAMSAIMNWMAWCSRMGLPKVLRSPE